MNIKNNNVSIGIFIPTFNGEKDLRRLLNKIEFDRYKLLIIDSSSSDGTTAMLDGYNIDYLVIRQKDFNHGATREIARKYINTDIVVMMTPDAYMEDSKSLNILVEPIINGEVVATYGRQIPHNDADIFESFPRKFNYPDYDIIKDKSKINEFGVFTFFFSDTFAAYDNKVLDEIGGFQPILTNEDYFAAAKIIMKGYKIKYVSDAVVKHSHNYTLSQEFKRYFDTGYVRAELHWVNKLVGSAEKRGNEFVKQLIKKLYKENKFLIPYAIIQSFVKWFGYRVGYYSLRMPKWWKKKLSSQKYYWDSKYYLSNK